MPLQQGLASLEDLVFSSEYEEVWMYDPRAKQWHEIGEKATGWSAMTLTDMQNRTLTMQNGAYIDPARFAQLCTHTNAAIHTHNVLKAPDYLQARMQEEYQVSSSMLNRVKISHALPSIQDLADMLRETVLCGDAPFSFYIGSYGGVTHFELTQLGRAHVRKLLADVTVSDIPNDMVLPVSAQEFVLNIDEKLIKATNMSVRQHGVTDYAMTVSDAFRRASGPYFRITYLSYRDPEMRR